MRADDFFAKLNAEHPEILAVAHEVDPPYILASNVLRLRNERGMTQAQLAEAIGIAQPRIAEVERGDANPRLITLSKIAHALGVSLADLLEDNLHGDRVEASAMEVTAPANVSPSAPAARKRSAG